MIQVYNVSYSGDRFGMIVANLSKKNLGRPYIKKKKNRLDVVVYTLIPAVQVEKVEGLYFETGPNKSLIPYLKT
jgi:hypothetical protein